MNVLIQHNFTSGLGDFIADVSHYLTILKELKNEGYEIHLRISLRGNKYTNGSFFRKLFSEETCSFFDSIEEVQDTIREKNFNEYTYHSSNHSPQSPGYHHFDIFFDVPPTEQLKYKAYDAQRAHLNSLFPDVLVKFSDNVLSRVESFWKQLPEDYYFLHIRTSDIIDGDTSRYDRIINNIKKYIEETKCNFHLGTNNKHIYNNLKGHKNIFLYEFKNYDLVNNDMNAFTNGWDNKNIETDVLTERMFDICAEIISIQKASKIYFLHDISWISNFLFYPICVRKNKIELINKNIWSN